MFAKLCKEDLSIIELLKCENLEASHKIENRIKMCCINNKTVQDQSSKFDLKII